MNQQAEFDFNAPPPEPPKASTPPPRAEILEKIKKLLRLGHSPNSAEAALAMQRAFELANRHGVDVDSLDLDERLEKLVHEYFHCGERPSYLRQRAIVIAVTFFNVNACQCRDRVVFVGRETDVAIAGYVYEFLVRSGTRCLSDFSTFEKKARRKVNAVKKKNFIQGFIYGVTRNLSAAKDAVQIDDARKAIVVAEEAAREQYMGDLVPNRATKKLTDSGRYNASAIEAGYALGRRTTIHSPLAGSSGGVRMLQ